MQKHKILFVVGGLHRAGAERFAYEIDLTLNKAKFDISILCLEKQIIHNEKWEERYYEKKHIELGTSISYIDNYLFKNTSGIVARGFHKLTKKRFKKKIEKWKPTFFNYLNSFNVIHWMGEYTFIHAVTENIRKKSLIHIMTAKFQNKNLYDNYDFNYPYHFISGFQQEEQKFEFSSFENLKHTYFPLILKINQNNNTWNFIDSEKKKIAIFTRLDRYKPIDPFLYSFQLLLDKIPNCELHIFGNGDPLKEGFFSILDRLAITDKVFFRGHQEDIIKILNIEHIDLSWFQGYNNDRPAGYAGFDVCTTGTPLVCWDFYPNPSTPFNDIYPHYKNLNRFVKKSIEVLTDSKKAQQLSQVQFDDISKTRNSTYFIGILEEIYQSIVAD